MSFGVPLGAWRPSGVPWELCGSLFERIGDHSGATWTAMECSGMLLEVHLTDCSILFAFWVQKMSQDVRKNTLTIPFDRKLWGTAWESLGNPVRIL